MQPSVCLWINQPINGFQSLAQNYIRLQKGNIIVNQCRKILILNISATRDESKWWAYFVTMKSNDDKRRINKEESRKLLVLFKNSFAYLQYNTDDEAGNKILIFSNKNKSSKKFFKLQETLVIFLVIQH